MNNKKQGKINVAFFQIVCPGYKRSMFESIQKLPGVNMTLFVGDKAPPGFPPNENLDSVSHELIRNKIFKIFGFSFIWQVTLGKFRVRDYDLILLSDGLLYLSNYIIMLICWFNKVPFGLYAHGFNHQRKNNGISSLLEKCRAFIHRRCDVLIVYSDDGAKHLMKFNKVEKKNIYIAKNTLDVNAIVKRSELFSNDELLMCRKSMGVSDDDILLIYVGRISSEKKPEWVVQTVNRLREEGLPVHAVFVGDGPALQSLKETISILSSDVKNSIHILGRFPMEDVDLFLKSADISVMPGMTGLAIVHSFALGKPYITVDSPIHSPEISYLHQDVNGLMAENNLDSFCNAVNLLVKDPLKRKAMGQCAYEYATSELSMENQLNAFERAFDCFRKG